MTVAISAEGGCAVVEIPDAEGECWQYEVRRLPDDVLERRWGVERRGDEEKEHGHTVSLRDGREWRCSCRAWLYSKPWLGKNCKHCEAVKEVVAFLKALTASVEP